MRQNLKQSIPALIVSAGKAANGATLHEADIHLVINTAAAINADRTGLINTNTAYEAGKAESASDRAVLVSLTETSHQFVTLVRDLLKSTLGKRYTHAWDILGFHGSLSVPRAAAKLQPQLLLVKAYLTSHSDKENEALNVTAARADGLATNLLTAINAVTTQKADLGDLKKQRDNAVLQMRTRLRELVQELKLLIEPLDPRWLAFGFNMPGALETPATPEQLTAVSQATGEVKVQFLASARAQFYHVFARVKGDATKVLELVGSPKDLNFTLTGQTSGTQLEICVSAVNNGGESAKSTMVTVTVM